MGDSAGEIHLSSARIINGQHLAQPDEAPRNQSNYRIGEHDKIGDGSIRQKGKNNLQAIRLVRALEGETRAATQEEKSTLVKYVGWGGIPQIFDPSGANGWENERQELASLLTEEEFESARATTLNAHYTSQEVIRGMYAAIQRFGFKHGRILEPACGVGHFIGCMPDDMHSHSTITGVEIDPITARITKVTGPG
jgi:hypothetical protein